MNSPGRNGENHGHEQMSRLDYANKVKAEFKQRSAFAEQFKPAIREQINRNFRDFQPPIYSKLRGQGKAHYQLAAEQASMMLVLATKRAPTETETAALTEFAVKRLDRWSLYKWAMTGVAGFFTWRGAKTYRFPFMNLTYTGKFHPVSGTPQMRIAWHGARFVAYYAVTWAMVDPLFLANDSRQSIAELKNDPRLVALRGAKLGGDFGNAQSSEEGYQTTDDQPQVGRSESNTSYEQSGFSGNSGSTPSQASWSKQTASKTPQETDPWSDFSNNDDASPIASFDRRQSGNTSNYGSAWDRVRSQTRSQPNTNAQRDQSSWGSSQPQTSWSTAEGEAGWNANAKNGQTPTEKDEAQKQFDQLVEKERSGTDSEQRSWSRK